MLTARLAAAALLAATLPAQGVQEKLPVLFITGANNHDWEWTAPTLKQALEETGRFTVDITEDPATTLGDAEAIADYEAFVLDYNGPRWGEPAETNFMTAVREKGVGVSVIHAANNAFDGWVDYETMVALCWRKGTGHGRFHPFDVMVADSAHPITRKMPGLRAHPDELYHRLVHMHDAPYTVLAHAVSSKESGGTGESEPMVIVREHGAGRIFHTPLGHVWRGQEATRASLRDPQLRRLIARGTEWAATGEVSLLPSPPNMLTLEEKQQGFRLLFDGVSTEAWRGYREEGFPEQGWVVENGCLHHRAKGGGGDLVTVAQFANFDLRFEWAIAPGGNSGVIYRCTEAQDACWKTGPEFQVYDDPEGVDPMHSTGALYALSAPNEDKVLRSAGLFNESRLVVVGRRVEHWLNGVRIVSFAMQGDDWDKALGASKFATMPGFAAAAKGHLALQDHGDAVWYRSIKIRELPDDDGR